MQPIEGFTPDMLWTFMVVLAGLGALIVLGDKVLDVWRKHKARQEIKDGPEGRLATQITNRIMAEIDERIEKIERKLSTDKIRLDDHEQRLAQLDEKSAKLEAGQRVICRALIALLAHNINGNSIDKLRDALVDTENYLIDK